MPRSKKTIEQDSASTEKKISIYNVSGGKKLDVNDMLDSHSRDIEDIRKDLASERQNNIIIFGIFASLVTFFSIEIQIFKSIENFWLLIGLSAFLVSSMLIFVLSLGAVIRNDLRWGVYFKNPLFWTFLFFLAFSFVIFFLNSKGINIDIKVKS
ncbi:MAG: hypothetical protein NTW50_04645 [Candidatus Berkelbacteria bacterium]|nr:hypothetical protein [Candidatus Berkelbacteria bacterium]